jgi:hypothetical protein
MSLNSIVFNVKFSLPKNDHPSLCTLFSTLPGQLLLYRADGLRASGPPTLIHMDGHGGPSPACSLSHEPTAARLRIGLGRPEPTNR